MAQTEKLYKYIVEADTTLTALLNDTLGLFYKYKDARSDFLNIKDEDGRSNKDRIYQYYTANINSPTFEIVKAGTVLIIYGSQSNIEILSLQGNNLFLKQDNNYAGFYSRKLKELHNNTKEYIKASETINKSGDIIAQIKNYNISVWIYVKSLDSIIDITAFITNISTNVTATGGSFNFTTNPIKDINKVLKSANGYINYFNIDSENNKDRVSNEFLNKKIQQNDIVFIRFEKLVYETDRKENIYYPDFGVNNSDLPNKIYDMIGLIDSNSINYSSAGNEMSINFSGRDFMKLLQEDGSYFFPLSMIKSVQTIFTDSFSEDKWFKRTFEGEFKYNWIHTRRSIKDTIGFIINQLSNLGVVKTDLFSAYTNSIDKDEKNRAETISITGDNKNYTQWHTVNGVWQITKVLVDDYLDNRVIANSQLKNPDGTLLDQFNALCQKPFVEFFGDTYGANYNFIVRQPPFTKNSILGWLSNNPIEIDKKDVYSYSFEWETEYYTWYQLTPQDAFIGTDKNTALAYLPVIWFSEYAEYFGNHRLAMTDNYQSLRAFQGEQMEGNINKFKQAIVEDFKLMIDSYIYLPFTRRGTITINGDRRIKRGTWIIFNPTNEVFYVDSVQNSFSANDKNIDRSTTLSVIRGMVYQNMFGKFSYFNIANTDLIYKSLIDKFATNKTTVSKVKNETQSNFLLNSDVFDYFLKRKQFDHTKDFRIKSH